MRIVTLVLTSSVILASTIAMARPLENDDEIKQALVGNTISGETNGQSYSEFLMLGDGARWRVYGPLAR